MIITLLIAAGGTPAPPASAAGGYSVIATIPVGSRPFGLAITPDGRRAYVTHNNTPGTVSVIDTATRQVTDTIPVGDSPYGVAVSPDGSYVYVANLGSNSVSVIDTATNTVSHTITMGISPYAVAISPNGSYLYVTNYDPGTVSVIDTATRAVIDTITVGARPDAVAVSPNGSYLYVANNSAGTVSVIDTATRAVIDTITVGADPHGVAVSPNGGYVYVANYTARSVSVIDTAADLVTATISGIASYAVAVSPDGTLAYVASGTLPGYMWIIDTATNRVTGTVATSAGTGVGVAPDGHYVYVTNFDAATVSVITYIPPGPPSPAQPQAGLTVTTGSPLPDAGIGHPYRTALSVAGGTGPYTWRRVSGGLPRGLRLSPGGVISGTPAAYGTYTFRVQVTAGTGVTATASTSTSAGKTFQLTVSPHADLAASLSPGGTFRTGHQQRFTVTVTNTGTQATAGARDSKVWFSAPHGLAVTTASGRHWRCHIHRHAAHCTRSTAIQPRARTQLTIRVHVTAAAGRTLTVTAKTAPTDATWHDNTARATVSIRS